MLVYVALASLSFLYWVIIANTHTWFFVALLFGAIWNDLRQLINVGVIYV